MNGYINLNVKVCRLVTYLREAYEYIRKLWYLFFNWVGLEGSRHGSVAGPQLYHTKFDWGNKACQTYLKIILAKNVMYNNKITKQSLVKILTCLVGGSTYWTSVIGEFS
jgi:hypothetical protein